MDPLSCVIVSLAEMISFSSMPYSTDDSVGTSLSSNVLAMTLHADSDKSRLVSSAVRRTDSTIGYFWFNLVNNEPDTMLSMVMIVSRRLDF